MEDLPRNMYLCATWRDMYPVVCHARRANFICSTPIRWVKGKALAILVVVFGLVTVPLRSWGQIFNSSAAPAVLAADAGGPIELGMKFTADQNGAISAMRFYKSLGNNGPHVGNLWSNTGTLLATATFTNETASGWQQANLVAPVAITANTVYVVSYHTPGSFSATWGYFDIPVDNPPLHAVVNTAGNGNGVYMFGANSVFPQYSGYGANYWVDVVFAPSTCGASLGGPSLVSLAVTPASPSIVSGSTQQFQAMGSCSDNSTADLTSQVSWSSGVPSVATITSGGLAAANAPGSSLITAALDGVTATATLTVTNAPPSSSTLFSSSATPVVPDNTAGSPIELGMKFTADRNGSISAIRSYKGSSNTGTHVGNLWGSTGQLLATVTFTNETPSGWQQANLAAPVAITANTVYVVSYHTPGSFSATWGYFNQPVDNPPLHAVVNSASNGNGVYLFGANSEFPQSSGYGANYWVDVVFTPGTGMESLLSLAVTPASPSIVSGSTQQFQAIGTYSDNSAADLTSQVSWSSGTPSVATIASGGLATGSAVGSSLITATVNGISGTATLTVTSAPDTLFSTSAIPAVLSADASGPVELGMKFTSDQNGSISAIRFYKGLGNNGPHVGNLWSNTGTLLATATFTNETASGWQQANLAAPVAITATNVYVVSYHTPGSFSANWGYFNQPVDNPPLHAVVSSAGNGNGVYMFGANSEFPQYNGYGANYWVDILFTDQASVPMSVTATTGSGQSTVVGGSFAAPLQATVKDGGGNPVSGAVVTFAAPGSGVSGTFANGTATTTVTTNSAGQATATLMANSTTGQYTVTATVAGVPTPASFSLTNLEGSPTGTAPSYQVDRKRGTNPILANTVPSVL